MEEKLCECGCGEIVTTRSYNKKIQNRFINGHNGRRIGKGYSINNGYKRLCFRGKDCYKYEHNIIMERYIGRELVEGEIVHHINGDKLDNRIENLKLMTISEHMKLHYPERLINKKGNFI